MTWFDALAGIEDLEDAEFDRALVEELGGDHLADDLLLELPLDDPVVDPVPGEGDHAGGSGLAEVVLGRDGEGGRLGVVGGAVVGDDDPPAIGEVRPEMLADRPHTPLEHVSFVEDRDDEVHLGR